MVSDVDFIHPEPEQSNFCSTKDQGSAHLFVPSATCLAPACSLDEETSSDFQLMKSLRAVNPCPKFSQTDMSEKLKVIQRNGIYAVQYNEFGEPKGSEACIFRISGTRHRQFYRNMSDSAIDLDHDGNPVKKNATRRDQVNIAFGTGEVGIFFFWV